MKQKIAILGATGSIGKSTLDVIARNSERYEVYAVTAHQSIDALLDICQRFSPRFAVVTDVAKAQTFAQQCQQARISTQVLSGASALDELVQKPDVGVVVAAIVGAAGLSSCFAAAQAGKRILLANKEALVMAGSVLMDAVAESGATLLPVDSEHNAIFQCLEDAYVCGQPLQSVRKILLTASGGPFRESTLAQLNDVTVEQAVAHPNWDMGKKISVDSATMMNKGLELIEACHLFACQADQIQIVVHPQSVIHSMVEFIDGSVISQMGLPDMRTPIANALAWPERIDSGVGSLDLFEYGQLNFEAPDLERFPCLRLAIEAAQKGQAACIVLNAANEIAVEAFLQERIAFLDIAHIIEQCLEQTQVDMPDNIDQVIAIDAKARDIAEQLVADLAH